MTKKISDAQLHRLSEFAARQFGLHLPKDRWPDLERAVRGAAEECGCGKDPDRYVQELLLPVVSQKQLEALASYLTVGETYFFREKGSLEALENNILPELIRRRRGKAIRIWSAGCATGEEPYSIAIIVNKLMAGLEKCDIDILATDVNCKSLQKASEGVYGNWSFRGVPQWVRSAYFETVQENRWAIRSSIGKMVRFAQLNLMDESFPPPSNSSPFDVIFCRNVLMYFTPEGMKKVIRQLYCSLASEGWLIVSPTEMSQDLFSEFATVDCGELTLYRKSATHRRKTPILPSVVCEENSFGPELTAPKLENPGPAPAPGRDPGKKSRNRETHSENTEPPAAPYDQALKLYEQRRYAELEQVIVALPSGNRDCAPATLLLSRAYANQGKLAAALTCCEKAIAADKMAGDAHYLRATILQEQGALPEAILALKQAIYAEPEFALAHFALGNMALKHGRPKDSEKHFENALLLLARYGPEDFVPEAEGISAARLREMIASQLGGAASAVPGSERPGLGFPRAGKPRRQQAGSR